MSEAATVAAGRDDVLAFLAGVPLLEGLPEPELAELARVVRRRRVPAGEVLWRTGDEPQEMLLVVDGRVSVSLHLPGHREVEIAGRRRGEVVGEIPLLDGGRHPTTARATEPSELVVLGRADFLALVGRNHPSAFALKRRIAGVACERLRLQLAALAGSLRGGPAPPPPPGPREELEPSRPPDSRYVRRMGRFRAFDALALWGFLTAGRYARCPPHHTLIHEGETSDSCYLVMNGAVERVIVRGGRRIRAGLAGPGQAFGYESLIDGGPSPVTAATRERCLLLVLPRPAFERLFHGETPGSHVFLDVVLRDLTAALRQALRPHARLASSVSRPDGEAAPPARPPGP